MNATNTPLDEASATRDNAKAATTARLGAITRELHEALRALGAAPELKRVIQEIPDSRARLSYVGEMTERAAHRVLTLVDDALPGLAAHQRRATELIDHCQAAGHASGGDAAGTTTLLGDFAIASSGFIDGQRRILSEIMLAQDFQDLSGQVIKSVIDMITRTERQLVQLLVDEADPDIVAANPFAVELQGPQTPENALQQTDVDDLLASMGF